MGCLIGIDGGGTKTRAVAVDLSGRKLAVSYAGPSNINLIDQDRFSKTIDSLLSDLLHNANCTPESVVYLVCGFAGAGRNSAKKSIESTFSEFGYSGKCRVSTDMEIALNGALHGQEGIVINAGTGSGAVGRDAGEKIERCGGWGYIVGDEGSGYSIGRKAVQYSLQSYDGMLPRTLLAEEICVRFSIGSIDMIIPEIYSGKITRSGIASLAPAVFEAAHNSDAVAKMIIDESGQYLGKLAETLLDRLEFTVEPVELCLSGSIFENKELLLPSILRTIIDRVKITEPKFPPVAGALLTAFKEAGMETGSGIENNLKKIKFI